MKEDVRRLRPKTKAAIILLLIGCSFLVFTPVAATLQGLQAGMAVPDFTVADMGGAKKKLSDIQGKRLSVVIFWSTSSARSEKNLARLEDFYRKYKDRGFTVIAVNVDGVNADQQTYAKINGTVEKLGLTYPVFVDERLTAFHDVGVIALPTTIVLDPERIIRFELSGYPLVGAEELFGFLAGTMEGEAAASGRTQAALPAGKEALRYYNLASNALKSKRMAESAEQWFKKAAEADPRFVQPHLSLGRLYLQRGDAAAAREQFEQALSREPNNVVALCELGMLFANAGETGKGMALLDKALAADEAYTPCYYYRGSVLYRMKEEAQAREMFDAAIANNPGDYNIYVSMARMYEEGGRLRDAEDAYRKALGLIVSREYAGE